MKQVQNRNLWNPKPGHGRRESRFFNLDNLKEKSYYYAIPEEELKTDKKLLNNIKEQILEKPQMEDVNVSYGVFPHQL